MGCIHGGGWWIHHHGGEVLYGAERGTRPTDNFRAGAPLPFLSFRKEDTGVIACQYDV